MYSNVDKEIKISNWYLPDYFKFHTMNKINSYNNSSYIETLFSYAASKLVEEGLCPTFPYYYGSANGIKHNYYQDINDEYDELKNKSWF